MVSSVTESLMQARIPMWALIFQLPQIRHRGAGKEGSIWSIPLLSS